MLAATPRSTQRFRVPGEAMHSPAQPWVRSRMLAVTPGSTQRFRGAALVMERRNRFYGVVTDGEGRVLVVDGSLPTWETTGPVNGHDAGPFNAGSAR